MGLETIQAALRAHEAGRTYEGPEPDVALTELLRELPVNSQDSYQQLVDAVLHGWNIGRGRQPRVASWTEHHDNERRATVRVYGRSHSPSE